MTNMLLTLKGKRFRMTTDEVRAEAERMIREANEADRIAEASNSANKPRGLFEGGEVVTKLDLLTLLTVHYPNDMRRRKTYTTRLWSWFENKALKGVLAKHCIDCGGEHDRFSNGCQCWKLTQHDWEGRIVFRIEDLVRLKDSFLGRPHALSEDTYLNLRALYDAIENRASSS